ncbi:toprim domain-containing protein [Piscinibacter sp. Jin2]|uniref:Toprim domain-containing protein n=1 Tax=Aquariibacter lacus TaxID=2801332 RepID=A0A9X1BRD1_9BURK|nr:toprim domain-containing protein [Piscinibacter lacus]MBL0719809.1 toprim domain-containing protein [Piscinibacter lacus]
MHSFRCAIHAQLGFAPEVIELGRIGRFSTTDRARDKAGWYRVINSGRAGVFGDFRRNVSSFWTLGRREAMTPIERSIMVRSLALMRAKRDAERRHQWNRNAQRNLLLWAQTLPLTGHDPASRYLESRGLAGPVPQQLRVHPSLTYWEDGDRSKWPAMVAPLLAPDGRMLALHRTYLTADGRKAPVSAVKKLTEASGPLAGACIPLHAPERGVIGIAEGIETAQAAHLASGLPTVAAYCASNLAAYIWPPATRRIVVFADADAAGTTATQTLKARAVRAGLDVKVLTPSTPGMDWCDVWAARTLTEVSA